MKAHLRYAIWCMISQKILTRCTFRGARVAPVKVSTKNKKLCTRISNSFSAETTFMWTSDFNKHEHLYYNYIRTEGRNFKTLLKEVYSVALDSCVEYLLNKC